MKTLCLISKLFKISLKHQQTRFIPIKVKVIPQQAEVAQGVPGRFFFLLALQPPLGVVFYSPLVGFSLLACEVS